MTQEDLVGKWLLKGSRRKIVMILQPDGMVSEEVNGEVRQTPKDITIEWRFIDERHWQLRTTIPPSPDTPGLEDGAIEVTDYEVVRFTGDEMELEAFDQEASVYERIKA
jgi:hypothetical protein